MTPSLLVAGLGIALAVIAGRSLSRRSGVPLPVFLVVAGAAASFIPHVPRFRLERFFARLLRDGFALSAAGDYQSFGEVAGQAAAFVPPEASADQRQAIVNAFSTPM